MKDLSFSPAENILYAQSQSIELRVEFPALEKGIVPFINNFGQLYWGKFSPQYLQQIYTKKKNELLSTLLCWQQIEQDSAEILPHLWFMMDFIRRPLPDQWNFPCLITKNQNQIQWQTGSNRLVASGMKHQDPSQHLIALVIDSDNYGTNHLLSESISIDNDQDLLTHVPNIDQVRLAAKIISENKRAQLLLTSIDPGYQFDDRNHDGFTYYEDFKFWHQQHKKKTTIKIYTDWPELLHDSSNLWIINIAGPVTEMKKQITVPGSLEKPMYHYHLFDKSDSEYTMWIVEPRFIDLGELAFWLNLHHSTFIDQDWSFAVYRRSSQYLSTFISLSRLQANKY